MKMVSTLFVGLLFVSSANAEQRFPSISDSLKAVSAMLGGENVVSQIEAIEKADDNVYALKKIDFVGVDLTITLSPVFQGVKALCLKIDRKSYNKGNVSKVECAE